MTSLKKKSGILESVPGLEQRLPHKSLFSVGERSQTSWTLPEKKSANQERAPPLWKAAFLDVRLFFFYFFFFFNAKEPRAVAEERPWTALRQSWLNQWSTKPGQR